MKKKNATKQQYTQMKNALKHNAWLVVSAQPNVSFYQYSGRSSVRVVSWSSPLTECCFFLIDQLPIALLTKGLVSVNIEKE